jgi:hypothetical protein
MFWLMKNMDENMFKWMKKIAPLIMLDHNNFFNFSMFWGFSARAMNKMIFFFSSFRMQM